MKKIIFGALALAAVVSCAKTEVENFSTVSENLITFEAPVVAPATKAIIDGTTYPTASYFKVSAIWVPEGKTFGNETTVWGGEDVMSYMDKVEVAYDEAKKGWTTNLPAQNPYFWPKKGSLTFQAFSPASVTAAIGANGVTATDYTVAPTNTAADQIDFLYSDRKADQTNNGAADKVYYGVDLTFRHALSSVLFNVKTSEDYSTLGTTIKVQKITIKDLKKTGSFAQNLTADQTTGNSAAWTIHADAETDTYTAFDPENVTGQTEQTVSNTNAAIGHTVIVMPQSFGSNDACLYVEYTIQQGEGEAIPQTFTSPLNGMKIMDGEENNTPLAFEIGKKYTFKLVIGLEKIYFAPAVTDWVGVTFVDTTI